jgi:F plasmid transfer operon, TraF, protein
MRILLIMVMLSVLTGSALATPQSSGARNAGMGNTGVASSDYLNAAFVNPARLTSYSVLEDDDWGLLLPSIGVLIGDPDSLIDELDNFTDSVDAIDAIFAAGNTPTQAQLDGLADDLRSLSGRSLNLRFNAATALAIPSKYFSGALMFNNFVDAQAFLAIDPNDANAIEGALSGTELPTLSSEAVAIGVAISEVGFAMAREFEIGGRNFSFGITPKMQRMEVINIGVALDDDPGDIENDFSDAQYRNDDTAFNIDLGAFYQATETMSFGLAARDLLGSSLASPLISGRRFSYDLNPVVTAAAAYEGETVTLAADLDLNQYERFSRGDESQFLRLGAETAWEWAQMRLGYQYDIAGGTNDIATAGIGLSPFGVFHLDLSAAAGKDTYGVILALSFTF